MARHAWLLVTPEMMNELYQYIHHRDLWVVVEGALPEDVRFVGSKPARNGAHYFLCASATFADLPASDWPELPRPRLMKQRDWQAQQVESARRVH
jgi:hypothetical protein